MFLRTVLLIAALQGIQAKYENCKRYSDVKWFCGNETMIDHSQGEYTCKLIDEACALAIIENADQNAVAYDVIKGYAAKHAFMGLTFDRDATDLWYWTDGDTPENKNYENWNNGGYTESNDHIDCGAIITIFGDNNDSGLERSKWNNGFCTDPCPVICQCPYKAIAVDDPHFVLNIHGSSLPVCFDYQGKNQDVVQMIYDKENDLVVNAQLKTVGEKDHTYFQAMSILSTACNIRVFVNGITVNSVNVEWKEMKAQKCGQVEYSINNKQELVVTLASRDIELMLTRKTNIEYLNFYMSNGHGISKNAKGIFGELSKLQVHVDGNANGPVNEEGWMTFPGDRQRQPIRVVKKERLGHQVSCWRVGHSGHDLLRGDQKDYVVPGLNFHQLAPGL